MINCICNKCRRNFEMTDEWAGRVVTCPFCSNPVPVVKDGYYIQPAAYPQSGTASVVLGILSLIFWLIPILGGPIAIAGIIVSSRQRSTGGLAMGIIGLVLSVINFIVSFFLAVRGYL